MLPFVVWPTQTAMVLWLICNLLMLAAGLAIFISLLDWQLSLGLFALVVCLSGFFLPTLTSTWLGQLSIFSFFILALTTYLFLRQRWTWLGIVVGLSFIKPQVMILLAGLLLLWALWRRRFRDFAWLRRGHGSSGAHLSSFLSPSRAKSLGEEGR